MWVLKTDGSDYDPQGRPLLCVIRNETRPRRSLRAGESITADNAGWTAAHRWLLEYDDSRSGDGALGTPFHICSMQDRRYLTVNAASGELVLQRERPDMLWEFHDAKSGASLEPTPPSTPSSEEECTPKTLELAVHEGALADALLAQPRTSDGSRAFTPLQTFLANGRELGEMVELASGPTTVFGVYMALFGSGSLFREELAAASDARVTPVQPLSHAPWCGTARTTQTITVPVLGARPFEEELRFGLCCVDGETTLAVQGSAKTSLPMGASLCTESLHIFSQAVAGGPVRLRAFGLPPRGMHAEKALKGMQEKFPEYVRLAQRLLVASPPSLLRLDRRLEEGSVRAPAEKLAVREPVQEAAVPQVGLLQQLLRQLQLPPLCCSPAQASKMLEAEVVLW